MENQIGLASWPPIPAHNPFHNTARSLICVNKRILQLQNELTSLQKRRTQLRTHLGALCYHPCVIQQDIQILNGFLQVHARCAVCQVNFYYSVPQN